MATLLEEVLQRSQENGSSSKARNSLLLDVYLLPHHHDETNEDTTIYQDLITLLPLLQNNNVNNDYPWWTGSPPFFGLHVSSGIPHLRAQCRYGGLQVSDEWKCIDWMLELSRQHLTVLVECWDEDDGQILLVESAAVLPRWVDKDGPEPNRHACWIRRGQVCLLEQQQQDGDILSIPEALQLLRDDASPRVHVLESVQTVIRQAIHRHCGEAAQCQRTALVLPRAVAALFREQPRLLALAVVAFAEEDDDTRSASDFLLTDDDWVWSTFSLGRTHYAVLRTLVRPPDWTSSSSHIPQRYQSIALRRFQNTCSNDATPHLAHAVSLGVRLVAGLEALLRLPEPPRGGAAERILQGWTRILLETGQDPSWLQQAFQAGPNHATVDLQPYLETPIYQDELEDRYLPGSESSVADTIRTGLKQGAKSNIETHIPGPKDVDGEEWMVWSEEPQTASNETDVADQMMHGVQSFLEAKSGVDGVESETFSYDPALFLRILHAMLKAKSMDEMPDLSDDRYFLDEDYEDMEPDEELVAGMEAMDEQLKREGFDDDVQVLSNLLQSIRASHGGAGPTQNILGELGVEAPDLDDDEEDFED